MLLRSQTKEAPVSIDDVAIGMRINTILLNIAVRVWLMQVLVSGFNFFVLMNLV